MMYVGTETAGVSQINIITNHLVNHWDSSTNPDLLANGITSIAEGSVLYGTESGAGVLDINDTDYPIINLTAPNNNSQITDTNTIYFNYTVYDNTSGIANCSLIINSTIYQTDTTIIEGAPQYFVQSLSDSYYEWLINCTDNSNYSNQASSELRYLTVGAVPQLAVELISVFDGFNTTDDNVTLMCNISSSVNVTNLTMWTNTTGSWHANGTYYYKDDLVINTTDLLAYYKFNNNSLDSSGNGHHGFHQGNPQNISGMVNYAYEFDGIDDYVDLTNDNALMFVANQSVTIMGWINPKEISGGYDNIFGRQTPCAGDGNYDIRFDGGDRLLFAYIDPTQSYGSVAYISNDPIQVNEWTHFAITYNFSNGFSFRGYINGGLTNDATWDSGSAGRGNHSPYTNTENEVHIGHWFGCATGNTYFFNGTIDEVAVWNRTLTAEEINKEYHRRADTMNATASFELDNLTVGDYNWNCEGYNLNNDSDWADANWTFNILESLEVELISPFDGFNTTDDNVTLSCNISSDVNLTNLTMWTNTTGVWHANETFYYDDDLVANTTDLLAYYKFNNNSLDSSGNGNDGTHGGNPQNITGVINEAYEFDGIDDYVNLSNLSLSGTQMSITGWINSENISKTQRIIGRWTSAGNQRSFHFSLGSSLGLSVSDDGLPASGASSNTILNDNQWYYIAVTYNAGNVTFYLNGQEDGNGTTDASINPAYTITYIGILQHDFDNAIDAYFNGTIDELSIYNRTLSPEEINKEYYRRADTMNATAEFDLDNLTVGYYNWNCEGYNLNNDSDWADANWTFNILEGPTLPSNGTHHNLSVQNNSVNNVYVYRLDEDTITNPIWKYGDNIGKCAMSFDGIDDFINISDDSSLSSVNKTLSAWVKLNEDGSPQLIAGKTNEQWFTYNNTMGGCIIDRLGFAIYDGDWQCASSTFKPESGKWYYLSGVYDGTNIYLYIDGILESGPVAQGNPSDTSYPFTIGASDGNANNFNGSIDEVQIFNRTLSSAEITESYQRGRIGLKSNITNNLVGAWGFDANCSGAGVIDESGNDNSGTISGATWKNKTSWYIEGNQEEFGLFLDGNGDYVNVSDDDSLSFGNDTDDDPFSVSAWIYMKDATQFRILNKAFNSTYHEYMFATTSTDKLIFQLRDEVNTEYIRTDSNIDMGVYEDEWIHVVGTYDGSSQASGLNLYIDGNPIDSTDLSNSYTAMHNSGGNLYMGTFFVSTGGKDYGNGSIDEVRIFNKTLTSSEIKDLYSRELIGASTELYDNDATLVGYWDFDTISDQYADKSGNNNDGTAIGNTSVSFVDYFTEDGTASSVYDQAAVFDGIGDYVTISQPGVGIDPFSVSSWIKADSNHSAGGIIRSTTGDRSEEHTSDSSHIPLSRMPSSA